MQTASDLVNEAFKRIPTPSPQADELLTDEKRKLTTSGPPPEPETPVNDAPSDGRVDSSGDAFDPAVHATDAEGRPKKTKTGKWAKKRGRKGNRVATSGTGNVRGTAEIEAERAGHATAQLIFTMGVVLGGEEWQPRIDTDTGLNEPQQMSEAWAAYYLATGKTDLPPWVTVVIAMCGYSLPRLAMPKTQTRIQRLKAWLGRYVGGMMKKREKKDAE